MPSPSNEEKAKAVQIIIAKVIMPTSLLPISNPNLLNTGVNKGKKPITNAAPNKVTLDFTSLKATANKLFNSVLISLIAILLFLLP